MGRIEGLLYQWEILFAKLSLYFQQVCIDPGFVLQRIHIDHSLSVSLFDKKINKMLQTELT